tara:strand:+ start:716 stop:1084 length:369 start_codon:yes stop_codon:yes gene_type:complete
MVFLRDMSDMSEDQLFSLKKMDPMARRALASVEAMQKAIDHNNRDDIEKHLGDAKNALEMLSDDLGLYDRLAKTVETTDTQVGQILKFDNTEGNLSANDGAIALGVVRAGRTDKIFRPHTVY